MAGQVDGDRARIAPHRFNRPDAGKMGSAVPFPIVRDHIRRAAQYDGDNGNVHADATGDLGI